MPLLIVITHRLAEPPTYTRNTDGSMLVETTWKHDVSDDTFAFFHVPSAAQLTRNVLPGHLASARLRVIQGLWTLVSRQKRRRKDAADHLSAGRTGLLVRIPLDSPDPAQNARRVFGAQFRLSPYRANPSVRCTHAVWHQTVGDYPPGSPYDFPCPRIGEE